MSRESPRTASHERAEAGAERRAMLWRLVFFIAVFITLQSLYEAAKGTWIERLIIDHATVQMAAWLINAVDPTVGVQPVGPRLRAPGGGINILNGCEGTEAVFLMMAAMLVAPLPLRARLSGLLAGTLVVYALNQARVVALFYAFRSDKSVFDMLHGIVGPLLLIIAATAFFVVWLSRHAVNADTAPAEQSA